MSAPRLTPWFGGDVKPTRIGVYMRRYNSSDTDGCYYSMWTGAGWLCSAFKPSDATADHAASPYQSIPWRGLSAKPRKRRAAATGGADK